MELKYSFPPATIMYKLFYKRFTYLIQIRSMVFIENKNMLHANTKTKRGNDNVDECRLELGKRERKTT